MINGGVYSNHQFYDLTAIVDWIALIESRKPCLLSRSRVAFGLFRRVGQNTITMIPGFFIVSSSYNLKLQASRTNCSAISGDALEDYSEDCLVTQVDSLCLTIFSMNRWLIQNCGRLISLENLEMKLDARFDPWLPSRSPKNSVVGWDDERIAINQQLKSQNRDDR